MTKETCHCERSDSGVRQSQTSKLFLHSHFLPPHPTSKGEIASSSPTPRNQRKRHCGTIVECGNLKPQTLVIRTLAMTRRTCHCERSDSECGNLKPQSSSCTLISTSHIPPLGRLLRRLRLLAMTRRVLPCPEFVDGDMVIDLTRSENGRGKWVCFMEFGKYWVSRHSPLCFYNLLLPFPFHSGGCLYRTALRAWWCRPP